MKDVLAISAFVLGAICAAFNWIGWIRWMRYDCSTALAEKMMKLLSCIAGAFLLVVVCWIIA